MRPIMLFSMNSQKSRKYEINMYLQKKKNKYILDVSPVAMNKINHRTHKLKKKKYSDSIPIIICYSGLSTIYQIEIYLNLLFYDYCSLQ